MTKGDFFYRYVVPKKIIRDEPGLDKACIKERLLRLKLDKGEAKVISQEILRKKLLK